MANPSWKCLTSGCDNPVTLRSTEDSHYCVDCFEAVENADFYTNAIMDYIRAYGFYDENDDSDNNTDDALYDKIHNLLMP